MGKMIVFNNAEKIEQEMSEVFYPVRKMQYAVEKFNEIEVLKPISTLEEVKKFLLDTLAYFTEKANEFILKQHPMIKYPETLYSAYGLDEFDYNYDCSEFLEHIDWEDGKIAFKSEYIDAEKTEIMQRYYYEAQTPQEKRCLKALNDLEATYLKAFEALKPQTRLKPNDIFQQIHLYKGKYGFSVPHFKKLAESF